MGMSQGKVGLIQVIARLRKRIRRDIQAESVMYPFVLVLAISVLIGLVVSGLSQYGVAGEVSQGQYPGLTMPFGLANYTTIDCDTEDARYVTYTKDGSTIEGYHVSEDDILDYVPYPTDEDPFVFWENGEIDEKKYVHIIRDNRDYDPESTDMWEMYLDFIAVRRDTGSYWDAKWNNAAIPFTSIEDNFFNNTNCSITEFQLSGSQDSIFINATYTGEANFTAGLWGNDFNIFYGWSLFRLGETDFWGAIAMAMYADIPGVDPMSEFVVHAFSTGVIIFVVITIALRMTPFLGD